MTVPIAYALAGAMLESFRTASIKDRANFWHIFGSRAFPGLAEPLAEAVRLAAAVELTASRMVEGVAFLDENPGLAEAGLARLYSLEARQGVFQRTQQLKQTTSGRDADDEHRFAQLLASVIAGDHTGAEEILSRIGRGVLSHPMADVICAHIYSQLGWEREARSRLVDGIQKLQLATYGAANADFWRAIGLVGARNGAFLGLLGELFAQSGSDFDVETAAATVLGLAELSHQSGSSSLDSVRGLRRGLEDLLRRRDARDFLPAQKWKRGVDLIVSSLVLERQLELEHKREVERRLELERRRELARRLDVERRLERDRPRRAAHAVREVDEDEASLDPDEDTPADDNEDGARADIDAGAARIERREAPDREQARMLGQAQIQQARLQFALGQEKGSIALLRQGYELLDEKREIRTVQLARPIDIPSIPSVRRFEVGALRPVALSPISRVDADPLRPTSGFNTQWAAEIDGANVLAGERSGSIFWYVTTRDGWMLADGLNVHPRLHFGSGRERMSSLSPAGRVLIDAPAKASASERLHGRSILLGGVPNYYHWLMEYLPKIGVLEGLLPGLLESNANWLVNDNIAPWQIECLSMLGVQTDLVRTVRSGMTTRCDSLVVPSMMSALDATTFLRQRLDVERSLTDKRMIYVSRLDADSPRRRVHQEELLAAALQQAGFEILVPSEMSFQDQLEAFATAAVIVGPHGAGMTNLVFAQKECVVVEIVNTYNQSYRFFSDIAEAVGFRYARFLSGSERANLVEPENANSVIDPQKLLSFIERLEAG